MRRPSNDRTKSMGRRVWLNTRSAGFGILQRNSAFFTELWYIRASIWYMVVGVGCRVTGRDIQQEIPLISGFRLLVLLTGGLVQPTRLSSRPPILSSPSPDPLRLSQLCPVEFRPRGGLNDVVTDLRICDPCIRHRIRI